MNHERAKGFVSFQPRLAIAGLGCIFLLGIGCEKSEIHSYRVPREFDAAATAPRGQAPSQTPERAVGWTLPETWREVETTAEMRVATIMTDTGLEVAVTAFPGDVGGLVANVNRWRGQVGLGSTDDEGVEEAIERIDGFDVVIVDISGVEDRLIGAVISVGDGQTWFLKVIGDSEALGAIKADLIELSKTFHLHSDHGPGLHAEPEHNHEDHAGHDHGDAPPEASGSGSARERWLQPDEWKTDTGASQILSAAYLAEGGARITLTVLGGDGGGLLDNINRWRGQVGIPEVASLDDQPMKDLGNGAVIVDLPSEDGSSRIVTGVVPGETQTLFFKLTGSASEVDVELERFEAFVNQVGLGKDGDS